MLGYLSADIICSEKRTVFRERSTRKTVSFEHIVAPNGGYCVHHHSNNLCNARRFENWGTFGHVTRLDQWLESENMMD